MKKILLTLLLGFAIQAVALAQDCGVSAENFVKVFGADDQALEKLLTPCFEKNTEGSYQRKVTVNGEEEWEYINFEDKNSIYFVSVIQKNRDVLQEKLIKYGFKHMKDAKAADGSTTSYYLKDKCDMQVWQSEGNFFVTLTLKK